MNIQDFSWDELHSYKVISSPEIGNIILTTTCPPDKIEAFLKEYADKNLNGEYENVDYFIEGKGYAAMTSTTVCSFPRIL